MASKTSTVCDNCNKDYDPYETYNNNGNSNIKIVRNVYPSHDYDIKKTTHLELCGTCTSKLTDSIILALPNVKIN